MTKKYRINGIKEECECWECAEPLWHGETAYEYDEAVYCSKTCVEKMEKREYEEETN